MTYLSHTVDPAFVPEGYRIMTIGGPSSFDFFRLHRDSIQLYRALDSIKPEAIYQRVGCAYTGITAKYAKRRGCRMIWHIAHDMDVRPFRRSRMIRHFLSAYLEKKFLEYGLRNCHDIISQTRSQAECLWRFYGRRATATVYNFHPFPAEELNKKERPVKIVWAANMREWKQPEHFIRLARDLDRRRLDVNCLMIGKPADDRKLIHSIQTAAAEVPTFKYIGPCSIEEVNSILATAHVFVNTSLEEGFANTFIQAWMRRVPVASLHCNFDDIFHRHRVGFYAGTYDTLLEQVVALVQDSGLRARMGEAAQKYAFDHHSMSNADRIIEIIDG